MQVECPHCHTSFDAAGDLPKEHKEAVGLAYYTALAATTPWDKVNNTGTLLSLLMTSANEALDEKTKRQLSLQYKIWGEAMMNYSNSIESESHQLHAAWQCQQILGTIGGLAYRYGKIPTGGFKLTESGGSR